MPDTRLILHVKGTEAETAELPREAVRVAISQGQLTQSQLIWSPAHHAWKQVREMPELLPAEQLILHVRGTEAETTELPRQAVRTAISEGRITQSQLIWSREHNAWKQVRELPDLLPSERLILHVKGTEAETTELPRQAVRTAVSEGRITHSQLIWSREHNAWKQVRELPDLMPNEQLILHVKGTEAETKEVPRQAVRTAISQGQITHSQLIWSPREHSWKQVRELPELLPTQKLAPAPPRVATTQPADEIVPESPSNPVARAVAAAVPVATPRVRVAAAQVGGPPRVRVAATQVEGPPRVRVAAASAEAPPRVRVAAVQAEAPPRARIVATPVAVPEPHVMEVPAETAQPPVAETLPETSPAHVAEIPVEEPQIPLSEALAEVPLTPAEETPAEAPQIHVVEAPAHVPKVRVAAVPAETPPATVVPTYVPKVRAVDEPQPHEATDKIPAFVPRVRAVAVPAETPVPTEIPRVRVAAATPPAEIPQVRVAAVAGAPKAQAKEAAETQAGGKAPAAGTLLVKHNDDFHFLKWICIGLGLLLLFVLGGNYFLVDRPLVSHLAETPYANVTVYAHFGAFMQPNVIVIHIPASAAISPDKLPEFLVELAHSTPEDPITRDLFARVALTSGWTAQYSFSGYSWKQLGNMEHEDAVRQKEAVMARLGDASGESLMPASTMNEEAQQAQREKVWKTFAAHFAAQP